MDLRTQTFFMGAAGGESVPDTYWINVISGTLHESNDIAVDSQKNVYSTFNSYGGSIPFVKFDKTGQLQFAKTIITPNNNSVNNRGWGIKVDSNDDVIIFGEAQQLGSNFSTNARNFIGKYTSAGVPIWNRIFWAGNYHSPYSAKPFVNSSGDIFFATRKRDAYYRYDVITVKYDSSGTNQFKRSIRGQKASGEGHFESGCAEDSNGNVYTCGGYKLNTASQYLAVLYKLDSSGIYLSYKLFGSSIRTYFRGIAIDSSDNVICVGDQNGVGIVVKFNSSGNIVWSTKISNSTSFRVAVDSSDDIYICGPGAAVNGVFNTFSVVAKLNSSGQVQWYRSISNSYISNKSIAVDNSAVYVTALVKDGTSTQYNNATFKLPKDGSLTGTYGNFVYSPLSYSISTPSNTNPTATFFNQQAGSSATVTYSDGNMTNTTSTTTTL